MKATCPQDGNVLFLILIAVALFAALSYAVTSSNRTSGESIGNEKGVINIARIMQDCATLRSTTHRFIMSGKSVAEIETDIANVAANPCRTGANCLFAAEGGRAIIPIPPQISGRNKSSGTIQNIVYNFFDAGGGGMMTGVNNGAPIPIFEVINLNLASCKELNKRSDVMGIPSTLPSGTRDGCYTPATDTYTYRCALSLN